MGQTSAVCDQCGYDFPPSLARPWWQRQSTLRGWLLVISVLGLPCAFLHYVPLLGRPWYTAMGLFACSLICARLLKNSPLWTTAFEALALGSLLAAFAIRP
jgi:hypothetical protein